MGIEREQMRKKAARALLANLSTGEGMTIREMRTKVFHEFGLSKSFVEEFLELYEPGLKEEGGRYKWKA